MPYPNEHAARVRNPGDFIPNSFRSKELKPGIRIIMGKLKTGTGSMVTQTYRFASDKFTVEEAKKWLKDNNISYLTFEPAIAEQSAMNDLFHVGVLGMKWGHRKASGSEDYQTATRLKKKKLKDMSNAELKTLTQRMQLEKSYKDLKPKKINIGKKAFSMTIGSLGKQTLAAAIAGVSVGVGGFFAKRILEKYGFPTGG